MSELVLLAAWGAFLCVLATWGGEAGQRTAGIATFVTFVLALCYASA